MKQWLGLILGVVMAGSAVAAPLWLDSGMLDPSAPEHQATFRALAKDAARRTAEAEATATPWLVQFQDVIQPAWRAAVTATGADIQAYIPENAYLVRATPAQVAALAALPAVSWIGEYAPEYKRSRAVRDILANRRAGIQADDAATVTFKKYLVQGFAEADGPALAARMAAMDGVTVEAVRGDGERCHIIARLSPMMLETVTGWSEVEWVEPVLPKQLFNDKAMLANMMNISNVWQGLSDGGLGLTGAGQIISVADTGLDTGNTATLHPDFTGRVTGFGWRNGAYNNSTSWADTDSHGTHVCGSVLGDGTQSAGKYRGMAYEARLIMQGTGDDLSGLDNLTPLFTQAFTNGARLHSDSWGYSDSGAYNSDSRLVDQFIWKNPTFLVLVAAGNEGIDSNGDGIIDLGSVSSPSTAKNCLTVGASKNYRTSGGYAGDTYGESWPDDYPADPIASAHVSGVEDPQGLCAFSSRGPCDDGRIKPDVVAPGTDIISTRSRRASDTGWGTLSGNTNYLYMGGTSMATPLTAGAMGLLRQWLVERQGFAEPSAALMKALIMNGARDMTPGQYGTGIYQEVRTRPDNNQGHGHVDLFRTLSPGTNVFFRLYDATNRLATGESHTYSVPVSVLTDGRYAFTMAYSDYYPASASSKQLVHDLDLSVTTPSGNILYPNGLTCADRTNNVELIEFTAVEIGEYTVTVTAHNVASAANQPYALVLRGPDTPPLDPSAPRFSADSGSTNIVAGTMLELNFRSLLVAGYPTPSMTLLTQADPETYAYENGLLFFQSWLTNTYTFTCTASNGYGATNYVLSITVTPGPPQPPQNVRATATHSTRFTAAWDAVHYATNYILDVTQGAPVGTELLSESFDSVSGTGAAVLPTGWSGANIFGSTLGNGILRVGSSNPGSVLTPDIEGEGVLSVVYEAASWTGDNTTLWIGLSSDGGTTFTQFSQTLSETITVYTQVFEDAVSPARIRWMSPTDAGKQRFHLDNIHVYAGAAPDPATRTAPPRATPVPGYPLSVGTSTFHEVTGLLPLTPYSFCVRAQSIWGTSADSATVTVETPDVPSAPVWQIIPLPPRTVVVGSSSEWDIAAFVSGIPAPELTLLEEETDEFILVDGTLLFEPVTTGNRTFTFVAANELGSVTNTLDVTVTAAPVLVPELTLSDPTDTTFLARWTECTGVSSYRLQVATNSSFSSGGAGDEILHESFETGSIPAGWLSDRVAVIAKTGADGAYVLSFSGAGQSLVTPPLENPAALSFLYARSKNTAEWTLTLQSGPSAEGPWTDVESISDADATFQTRTIPLTGLTGPVYFRLLDARSTGSHQRYVDLLIVQSSGGGGGMVLDANITGHERRLDALTPETTYWARVKGTSDWSVVQQIQTTAAGPSAPVWLDFGSPTATVGLPWTLDLADYVSANPAPALSLTAGNATLEGSLLSFTPDAPGDHIFSLRATNTLGFADTTLTVIASDAPILIPTVSAPLISSNTFTAEWTPCTGAETYQIQVATDTLFSAGGTLLTEDFARFTATGSSDISSSLDTYTATPGWAGVKVFCDSGRAKLGSSNASGSLTTPPLDLTGATLTCLLSPYGSDANTVSIDLTTDNAATFTTLTNLTPNSTLLTLPVTGGGPSSRIRIQSSSRRFYLDDVTLSTGGGSILLDETLTGLSLEVTQLTPRTAYFVRVRMTDGEWSPPLSVTTTDGGDVPPEPIHIQPMIVNNGGFAFGLPALPEGSTVRLFAADTLLSNAWNWHELAEGWSISNSILYIAPATNLQNIYRIGH